MQKLYTLLLGTILLLAAPLYAQQLPNANFEAWNGSFDGNAQPDNWNASNVTQFGFKFNFAHKEAGHTGNASMMVQDQDVGAAGITETSPGYFALGQPWVYVKSLTSVGEASAGTEGGIRWAYRPDTMSVWIKRTGSNVDKEDFYLLYYAWSGTAKSSKYKGKNGSCTSTTRTNEESDIRLALDGNECGTDQKATQIAEGMWREKKEYKEWVNIRVPIYYFNNNTPEMMNIIFSASNYPNFRANSGLYAGNSLYVDDVELIYASNIQKLYIDGREWKGFNPYTEEEQTYSLGRAATTIPAIKGVRGIGSITNARGTSVSFSGRELTDSELTITQGTIDGEPTILTVRAEDGSSTHTYKIRFVREPSNNTRLANIMVNGESLSAYGTTFNPAVLLYTVALPYGTTEPPVITAEGQEDAQTIRIQQPTATNGTATITVTAADGKTTASYTLTFTIAELADNTLQDILVNGNSVTGFMPGKLSYRVSLPTTTTTMPTVKAVSAYPDGAQTIQYIAPATIQDGVYQIQVSSPGNPVPKTYKLTFKLEKSSYAYLKDLQVGEGLLTNFSPEQFTYYIHLPLGTTQLPEITYIKGNEQQSVSVVTGGLDGTTQVIVTAEDGQTQSEYKLVFSTEKSELSHLNMIYVGGTPLPDFSPDKTSYSYALPIGTTVLPEITVDKGDEYESVNIVSGGVNGTTRIAVTAGNGNSTLYQIAFSVLQATNSALQAIYIDGELLEGFDPERLEYTFLLPKGTTQLPLITCTPSDEYQTITTRSGGVNGEYKITVRPQSGSSRTYIIRFSVETSDNTTLQMIYLDDEPLPGFDPAITEYNDTLPMGVSTLPDVTYLKGDESQKVLNLRQGTTQTLIVTAESGTSRTYTIRFHIQRAESAYLRMIYLDGTPLSGFDKQQFSYTASLSGTTCPAITVDKEEGQQVTITTPYATGRADILVRADLQSSSANTYTIDFVDVADNHALLTAIYANGELLADYQSTVFEYTLSYSGAMPAITYDAQEGQTVTLFREQSSLTLYVVAGSDKAQYTLHLAQQVSHDTSLRAILLNGTGLEGFSSATRDYTIPLAAGATRPVVTYEAQDATQVVYAGAVDAQTYCLFVCAEGGDTARYTLRFDRKLYDNANLADLQVEGYAITFSPTTYEYHIDLPAGMPLPALHITPDEGQSTAVYAHSADEQQILVTAADGTTNTYRIFYTRIPSAIATLSDILLDGKSLQGFRSDVYAYTDTLAWRTRTVPCVQPVGTVSNQIITTCHSAVNGTTRIHVEAADGVTTQDYTIAFPVRQSSNTALKSIILEHEAVSLPFDPEVTDYTIVLPYQEQSMPFISYEPEEEEQDIQYISRPLGQTTQIIVTAENGDQRTYNLLFLPTYSTQPNVLDSLIVVETGQLISPTDSVVAIPLPYGCKTMTVQYKKSFDEQTVWVQPGGVYRPTVISVRPNRPDEAEKVYTLTPVLETQDPAVLTSITVDGTLLADFTPDRFTYIVNRSSTGTPNVTYTADSGVQCNPIGDTWRWTATVKAGTRTNTYTIFFHYPASIIPNGEFDQWTKTASSNSDKPTSWNAPGDYINKYLGTAKAGDAVKKDGNSVVHLKNIFWMALAGPVPAVINLADMTANFAVAGGTRVTPSGAISFLNTPDNATISYKYTVKAGNGALFRFVFSDNNKNKYTFDHRDTGTSSAYKTQTIQLGIDNKPISGLDVIIDASGNYPDGHSDAELYVDYIRFSYNSTLAALKVNGTNATLSGNAFTVTLTDIDASAPALAFTGAVSDQAQKVTWQDETVSGNYGVRKAAIINYAEDGTHTDYTLEVRRPLETRSTLSDLLIDGSSYTKFSPATSDYTYHLTSDTRCLPSICPVAQSNLQAITTAYSDSVYTITVTPEQGEATVYTTRFTTDLSSDTHLAALSATGITFQPDQTEYDLTAESMPSISFTKQSNSQTVALHKGILTVTAEDGTTGTYTIRLHQPAVHTAGRLSALAIEAIELATFDASTYDYILPRPSYTTFRRNAVQDSVIFTQTPTRLKWQVVGTDEEHTYTLTYPTTLSANTNLAAILLNGDTIEGFNPTITEYAYSTNDPVHLQVVANATASLLTQKHDTIGGNNVYSYTVTAEDGTVGRPYYVRVVPVRSSDPYLQSISLNGTPIADFRPDSANYTVTLPVGAVKEAEPTMPSIAYALGNANQQVILEHGRLGETTTLIVTSEDGTQRFTYNILVQSEPSHNAALTGIAVNGVPVSGFSPRRVYYFHKTSDSDIQLTWASDDRFQTVQTSQSGDVYTLHVTAQDGIMVEDYQVEIYHEPASDDATLSSILLDGTGFDQFYPSLNPSLAFSAMQQRYTIHLPSGATTTPDVSAALKEEGQSVAIRTENWNTYLDVTAADGTTTNTYSLLFLTPQSSNTALKMIYVDNVPLAAFDPDTHTYTVALPVGITALPQVFAETGDAFQTLRTSLVGQWQYTIHVTAEDGSEGQYTLIFTPTLSSIDTVAAIYADGVLLRGFRADSLYYAYTLPVGSRLPEISWDEGDAYQRVDTTTISRTPYQHTLLLQATAQAGNSRTYTVAYEVALSANDTARMIYFRNDSLPGFAGGTVEYTITLRDTIAPAATDVYVEAGDAYQTITLSEVLPYKVQQQSLGWKQSATIVAQDGHSRTYTLYFLRPTQQSDNTTLQAIYINGQPLLGFLPDKRIYFDTIPEGEPLPSVLWEKAEPQQRVSASLGDTTVLTVTAEDATTTGTYRIYFHHRKSANAYLDALYCDGTLLEGFRPDSMDYTLTLPYGRVGLPVITWTPDAYVAGVQERRVATDTSAYTLPDGRTRTVLHLAVTAADGENTADYTVNIYTSLNSDAHLSGIYVRGTLVEGFCADTLHYDLVYPIGTDSDRLATVADIQALPNDPQAVVSVVASGLDFILQVTAADGQTTCVYTLRQTILLSGNNRLRTILLNGAPIPDFGADTLAYTYYVTDAQPTIEPIAEDTTATIDVGMYVEGEAFSIYVTAANGDERTYTILFLPSSLHTSQTPTSNDVLVKYLGNRTVAFATIRKNVSVAVYTEQGQMLYHKSLSDSDQNDATVIINADGQEQLVDVRTSTAQYTLPHAGIRYLYTFIENEKRVFASGKLSINP